MYTVSYHKPHPLLQEYVDHYKYDCVSVGGFRVPSLKENFMQFILKGTYQVVHRVTGEPRPIPASAFVGQRSSLELDFVPGDDFETVLVYFKPMGAHKLFGLPLQSFANTAFFLDDVFESRLQPVIERLKNTQGAEERMKAMDEFLLQQASRMQPHNEHFQKAVHYIVSQRGDVSLPWVISQCFMSERQFQRKFLEQVGTSPKTFIKRLKFDYIINIKRMHPATSWTKLAYRAGYFDQAHFIREFKSITSETPSGFIQKVYDFPDLVGLAKSL